MPANKTTSDARLSRGGIKASNGSTIARNGMARRKRLLGVDCQATTASGMPANKMRPNASAAPARITCPASVKTDSVAITSLTDELCNRMKKKKAMTSEQIAAEKIFVN